MTAVYLAGPIAGCSDAQAKDWRAKASDLLGGQVLDPMARDFRGAGPVDPALIVEGDKADIASASAVLAYCPFPSVGTSMEVLYAHDLGLPVVVVVPAGRPVSPWLRYHSRAVVMTVAEGVARILHEIG